MAESSRPLLLPQNRKLRHLQGIYLRNLTLTRPRGQTIDDQSLNKTPSKLEALRSPQLHHAHSHSELQQRPPKLRRRSTNWAGASPATRQKKLEDVIDSRMADTFFSLHVKGMEEPVYISEVVEKAMNPSYRFFDLSGFGPATTRLDTLVVRVWVKREEYVPLIEEEVHLGSLQFIGTLENHVFPPNCIIFRLVDGLYTIDLASKPPKPKHAPTLPTSSYSALMRLSNLDESIQDALATREELAAQINAILQAQAVDDSPQAREEVVLANRYITAEKKLLKASINRRAELKASIAARSKAIQLGKELQSRALEDINNAQEKLSNCRTLQGNATAEIHGQRRRICEELLAIFPIEPTDHSLLFTICGLPLPNSSFEDAEEDLVSAALGYVARLVDMLQYYLAVPLPYPITSHGSKSIIHDAISILQDNQRTFPLYMKHTVRFRFDYGVFLLNKNIECLAESQGLRVVDIRQTLPNLKYLLFVCSAGSSDLPSRKVGGIRGLFAARAGNESRRGSAGSATGTEAVRKALENGKARVGTKGEVDGNGNGAMGKGGEHFHETTLSFRGNYVNSPRTKGLRENVAR